MNNTAETSHSGELTSGRGGAIFHNNNSGGGSSTFTIAAVDADNPVLFSGNNHNPGAAGLESNGIYFGTTLTDGGVQTTNFEVSAGAEAFVNMYDPMASHGDNLTNSNGDIYNRLVVNVDKTGAGTWLLGGHNKMQSESHWNIREGELHLVGGVSLLSRSADNPAVTIELSHPDSSFTLHPGARLMAAIGGESHLISANEIHLLAGSTAGVIGLYNQPFVVPNALPDAPLEVLTLSHGSLLRHEQEIEQQSGVMEVGLSNYNFAFTGEVRIILFFTWIIYPWPARTMARPACAAGRPLKLYPPREPWLWPA